MCGHAIEVRVCAEDPSNDFLPAIGPIVRWQARPMAGVRYESGVDSGSQVTIHYDPLLAKVIGAGQDRAEATRRLRRALRHLRLDGVRSNLAFLDALLGDADFAAARLDTGFLERHPELARAAVAPAVARDHAVAAALWAQAERRRTAAVLGSLPSGWRNNPTQKQSFRIRDERGEHAVAYRAEADGVFAVDYDETTDLTVLLVASDAGGITIEMQGHRRRYELLRSGDRWYVHSAAGRSEFEQIPRFRVADTEDAGGGCHASMPGRILDVRVAAGADVAKGDVRVVMEAMKMEHEIKSPLDGRVAEVRVAVGDQVEAGAVLVVVEAPEGEPSRD
jgi:propionyl-CoA carboxylase alpha chain